MKRKIYILISLLSLGALMGTAGASDLGNTDILTTFICTVLWTSLFIGFGMAARKSAHGDGNPTKAHKKYHNFKINHFRRFVKWLTWLTKKKS